MNTYSFLIGADTNAYSYLNIEAETDEEAVAQACKEAENAALDPAWDIHSLRIVHGYREDDKGEEEEMVAEDIMLDKHAPIWPSSNERTLIEALRAACMLPREEQRNARVEAFDAYLEEVYSR